MTVLNGLCQINKATCTIAGYYHPSPGTYRFDFNGKEKDNNGELGLTTYNYGFRIRIKSTGFK